MTVRAEDFREVARLLMRQESSEACERSAISRAYYAAFHAARAYCESTGTAIPRHNPHVEVRWRLEMLGQDAIAADLRKLQIWRTHADYDIAVPLEDAVASTQMLIVLAEHVVNRLEALPRKAS
jgi:uncharacterized protein (UPF0332 family)